jgi:L-xylulokinase
MNYLMGIDNGGTIIKAAIYNEKGEQISVNRQKIHLITPKAGFTERNMEEIWQANVRAIKGAIESVNIDSKDIKAIGISGHGKGIYMLDKQGNPVYNGIVSTDNRAVEYQILYNKNGVAEKVYETNYQKVLASQPVCLLKWFKDNDRKVYDKIAYVLSVKDYIRYRLTNKIFVERTDISGSNLINLTTGKKDLQLLKLFDIEEMYNCIPEIKSSIDNCGQVTLNAANETNLAEGTIVSGGMFDIDACALSMGITDSENICVIAGTWSINEYISKVPVKDKSVSMNSYYCMPDYYLIEECSPTSAGNLEWYLNNFSDTKDYKVLDERVQSIKPQDCKVIFLPFIFASNESNSLMQGTFVNLSGSTSKEEMLRSVYEGIVFSHKSHIDRLLSSRNRPKAIRLTGGAANSKIWSQMFADILGLPIETISDKEHGCFGVALGAGITSGLYKDFESAVKDTVKVEDVFYPDTEKQQIYSEKYNMYRKLVNSIDKFYEV